MFVRRPPVCSWRDHLRCKLSHELWSAPRLLTSTNDHSIESRGRWTRRRGRRPSCQHAVQFVLEVGKQVQIFDCLFPLGILPIDLSRCFHAFTYLKHVSPRGTSGAQEASQIELQWAWSSPSLIKLSRGLETLAISSRQESGVPLKIFD